MPKARDFRNAPRLSGLGLALLIIGASDQGHAAEGAAPACGGHVVLAADSAHALAALKAAKDGDIIRLAPGEYGLGKLQNISFSGAVTLTSADSEHPAVLSGLLLQNISGMTFRNLEVKVDDRQGGAVILRGGKSVRFENLNIHGTAVGDGGGLMVSNGTDIVASNLDIHEVSGGMVFSHSDGVTVTENAIHDIQCDGMQVQGVSHIKIAGNHFTEFHPSKTDHSDAIQFFTAGTKEAAHDIEITENVYVRGAVAPDTQGIFMGDEAKVHYENVTVSKNVILGAVYHGIMIAGATNLTLTQNVVKAYSDMNSWIRIIGDENVEMSDNTATSFNPGNNNKAVKEVRSKRISPGKVGDLSPLSGLQNAAAVGPGARKDRAEGTCARS